MPKAGTKTEKLYNPELLRMSPIHGIKPIDDREIEVNLIDEDPTNPGTDKFSRRYARRQPDIRESYDIIGGVIYPLVVCQSEDSPNRFLAVDGHGRLHEVRRRGVKKIRALIFPFLTLEQRICLREVLNAAQEPFDTPLVLKDLHLLAKQRRLDIRNDHDLESLLADLPATIREKHDDKLRLLAKWPEDVADKIGVDDNRDAGIIGLDKVKELDMFVTAVRKTHPAAVKAFPGEALYRQVLKLYSKGNFRDGRRSQDTLRDVRRILKQLPQDHEAVTRLVNGTIDLGEFKVEAEPNLSDRKQGLVALCKELTSSLTDLNAESLTADERRSLKRTADLVSRVLDEAVSV